MTNRLRLIVLGVASWLTTTVVAADDVEVLARGPVHEAYAEPAEREPRPTPIVPKEPPNPIEELPPDQKPEGDNVRWMPGYWAWDADKMDYLWVSGFWRNSPPSRTWVPGSWRKAGDGWQWTGGFWAPAGQDNKAQVEYLPQPPAPLDDAGATTPAPGDDQLYVPGSWVYRDRYVWRPGYWTDFRPGWVWSAAHYRWTPAGYVFIDGYWDYPLVDRGVLFAPVYIPPAVYAAPAYVYTPSYVVQESALFGAFFCRRGFGSYYFGDYFAPAYAGLGFSAWIGNVGISIGVGRGYYDPLFAYYRHGFRADPFWGGGGIHNLYAGRYRGDYLRPPVNLVQQNTVINNITKNTNINNVNVNNVQMVSSLNQVARGGRRNFQQVSEPNRRQFAQEAAATRDVAARRASTEADLATRPGAGTRTAPPRQAALDVLPARVAPKGGPKGPGGGGAATGAATIPVPPPAPRPSGMGRLRPGAGDGGPLPKGTVPTLPTPKGGAGTPKVDPGVRPPSVDPRPLPKGNAPSPPPTGPKVNPGVRPPTVDPRPLPKAPAPKVDLPRPSPPPVPKANPGNPRSGPGVPQGLGTGVGRPVVPQAFKPPAPRPPATLPKPPASIPQRSFSPPASVPRVAPRPAPAAPRVTPRPAPAGPRKGKG